MIVQEQIENALTQLLSPVVLDVVNESSQHNVPPDSETHFKVVIVSEQFVGRRKVARHQQVYGAVSELLAGPVHALALHTYTPEEWQVQGNSPQSQNCMGGSKGEDL